MQLAHPGVDFKDTDSAAFEVAKMIGGDVFVTVFLAGLILAQFASGISAQASVGRLLYAMGYETANVHLGTAKARTLAKDLQSRTRGWLYRAARKMEKAVMTDFEEYSAS